MAFNAIIAGGRGGLNYANSRDKKLNRKQSAVVGSAAAAPTYAGFKAGDKVVKEGLDKTKHIASPANMGKADKFVDKVGRKALAMHVGKKWGVELGGLAAGGYAARKAQQHFLHKRKSLHQGINTTRDQHWRNTQTNF